jgi:hypothetical protein
MIDIWQLSVASTSCVGTGRDARDRCPLASLYANIVYREQHAKLRTDRKTMVDVAASVNEYLDQEDWRANANANQGLFAGRPDSQRVR